MKEYANKRLYVPAFKSTPGSTINATGAGDAFIGGVLAGFNLPAARVGGLERVMKVGHAAALQRVEVGRLALTAPQVLQAMDAGQLPVMPSTNPHLLAAIGGAVAGNVSPARRPRARSPVRRGKARTVHD